MTPQQQRLVGYLEWVDDEDFTEPELTFLRGLMGNLEVVLTRLEDRVLRRLHRERGY